jgi:3D (Asp-Asp-Asp) domain-containing protein
MRDFDRRSGRFTASLLALILASAATTAEAPPTPATHLELLPLGSFRVSYYWVAMEDERFAGLPRDRAVLDMQGQELARVSAAYLEELLLEGTGRLADGRLLNFAGRVHGSSRFTEVSHRWGLGVDDQPLTPFLSVATDPELIPTGSRLRIEEFVGFLKPDGTPHTGLFQADDVGSGIRGRRLDIFIGDRSQLEQVESVVRETGGDLTVLRVVTSSPGP